MKATIADNYIEHFNANSGDEFIIPVLPKKEIPNAETFSSILGKNWRNPKKILKELGAKILYDNSPFAAEIRGKPGGWRALHRIYQNKPETGLDEFLLNLPACEGTRERKEKYKKILHKSIEELYEKGIKDPHVLELGSGPGLIPMESVCKNGNEDGHTKLVFVDIDRSALTFGKQIAEANRISEKALFKRYDVRKISIKEPPESYHIVGTHGIMDYFTDESAIEFLKDINKVLVPSGKLVATNMTGHSDYLSKWLMEALGGWKLIYRSAEKFKDIMEKSGVFENIQVSLLPSKFHVLATGKKKSI
jgi:Methyltransferase domain.